MACHARFPFFARAPSTRPSPDRPVSLVPRARPPHRIPSHPRSYAIVALAWCSLLLHAQILGLPLGPGSAHRRSFRTHINTRSRIAVPTTRSHKFDFATRPHQCPSFVGLSYVCGLQKLGERLQRVSASLLKRVCANAVPSGSTTARPRPRKEDAPVDHCGWPSGMP
jgi:hypothetical protein